MTIKAVLFGSIGTIIETSDIQRSCFNQAFQKVGLNWYWSKKIYKSMLKKEKLTTRDSRAVERKKYGHRKARRSFQFSKR